MNGFANATFRVTVAAVILSAAVFCRGQDAPRNRRQMENRFLFLIDTSSSMRSRTNGIEEAVAGLLKSDMNGQFRKGDTLGIWTYSDQLRADFPMQVWSPENKDEILKDVLRFLRHQRYEKRAHLDKVLGAVARVMEKSERLTVILIHDGSEPIRGTEFDGDINDSQKRYARQLRSAHLPMVTVLAARFGQVFDYTINYPGAVSVPHTATPLPPPQTNAAPAAAVAVVPALVTNPAPAEPSPPRRRIEIIMSGTNSVTRTMTPEEAEADNLPSAPSNIVMAGTVPSQPPPATAIASNPPPSAPKPQPEATPVPSPPPPKIQATSAPVPIPAAAPLPVPSPLPVSMPAPDRAPAPAPVAFAAASGGQQVALFVIAFSLLTIAVVLVVWLIRRSRGDAPPSLISQSIDRRR